MITQNSIINILKESINGKIILVGAGIHDLTGMDVLDSMKAFSSVQAAANYIVVEAKEHGIKDKEFAEKMKKVKTTKDLISTVIEYDDNEVFAISEIQIK